MDGSGIVAVSLIAGFTSGTATITAESTGLSQQIQIFIGAGSEPITLTLSPANGIVPLNGTLTITAIIRNRDGTPIPLGEPVTFTTTEGIFNNGARTYTTPAVELGNQGNGAIAVLVASDKPEQAFVTCSALGFNKTVTVHFGTPGEPDYLELTANPTTLYADGEDKSVITAAVYTPQSRRRRGNDNTFPNNTGYIFQWISGN